CVRDGFGGGLDFW
nr:immunoglobulin heavy chain junction region [Macaca mulatta]MOY18199.1 immunoglobulin heavy chain junction region [Macaca mulatta]MOY18437.1 immunoglobulin heavy chain junction region [Macaca mulatta]MOY18476.1 immunoglobulin heavy chain junction region [Macaca mulatta]MOY19197.1 immunoglobulin heavy chain junction region [Macaca mulatta]